MSLNKKIIIIPAILIIAVILIGLSTNEPAVKKNVPFHVTLAEPGLYVNGVYTDTFGIEEGEYLFRFVPNGSSPKVLSITLSGSSFEYAQDFELVGTLHQTGISEYHTWDYDGEKNITISEMQKISIAINPNGQTDGSVSVDILEN